MNVFLQKRYKRYKKVKKPGLFFNLDAMYENFVTFRIPKDPYNPAECPT